ncbi:MAG: hydrogenase iron-sulfur subunit [Methanophagales archaeon ANME-1-THS]|nr:MAG: hydrogenase iron-sulfur subunit [Methanophagales archaeon ANME-1-THS]
MIRITEVEFVTPGGITVKRLEDSDLRAQYAFPVAVNEAICCGCRQCELACENKNIRFVEEKGIVAINDLACKGCGSCVAVCPSGALYHRFFSTEEVFAALDSDRDLESSEVCPRSMAVEFDGSKQEQQSIRLVCARYADPSVILRYFESGVDGVLVINCCSAHEVDRHDAEQGVGIAKELLETLGIDPRRIHLEWISLRDPGFDKRLGEFARHLGNGKDN